ncbi:MAG: glycosyltransferase family 4 protein [Phycisphaerales bacterium]|jgi:glycosyltransferase involved in cell wall biosynthesis|nr:glycosyltransferase family 4 protein [Phycisphaerales bacterium]
MKIFICYRYGILGGCASQLVQRLRGMTPEARSQVTIVFGEEHGASPAFDGLCDVRIAKGGAFGSLLDELGPDVVSIIDSPEFVAPSRRRGIPVCFEVHTTVERGLAHFADRDWTADLWLVPSEFSRDMVRRRGFIKEDERLELLPNCLDTAMFMPDGDARRLESPPIVWVGKLDEHKNWRDAVDVMGRVAATRDVQCWVVGGVTAPPQPMRELIGAARRHDLLGRFHWWPQVEYHHMPYLYRTAAASGGCMLITSIAESFGMCAAEALACGLPIVSTPVGAIEEMTDGSGFGALFDHGDIPLAADEVVACLDEPSEQRSEAAERCRGLLKSCDTVAVASKFMDLLSSISSEP